MALAATAFDEKALVGTVVRWDKLQVVEDFFGDLQPCSGPKRGLAG